MGNYWLDLDEEKEYELCFQFDSDPEIVLSTLKDGEEFKMAWGLFSFSMVAGISNSAVSFTDSNANKKVAFFFKKKQMFNWLKKIFVRKDE